MDSVRIENICKRFRSTIALDSVSFTIAQGEIFGLLGPNGAGKTTLMRILVGILGPDDGTVELAKSSSRAWKERIGYLPEDRGLYPKMKVRDMLRFFAALKSVPSSELSQRLEDGIKRVGIEEHADKLVQELSKGNQQRVQLLLTLMHEPDLLVLDEPFTGLDPIGVDRMKQILLEETQRGATVIISTHRMEDAEELCQSIALIHQGQVIRYGQLGEIKRHEGHEALIVEYDETATPYREDGEFSSKPIASGVMQVELNGQFSVSETIQAISNRYAVLSVNRQTPKLHDIFVSLVGKDGAE